MFFVAIGFIAVFAVFTGFAKPFIVPVATGTFEAPFILYLHGAFAFGWVLLFLLQALLIKFRKHRLHMSLGTLGLILALGSAITIIPAGLFQVERELKEGLGDTAISTILGASISALIFFLLFLGGMAYRKNPQAHKRLMLLATLVILWPAWFRFRHYFPAVPRPDIWFGFVLADIFIIIAMLWDKMVNEKIHPVLLYVGSFIILEHILEVLLFDSYYWRIISRTLYQFYT